MSKDYQTNQDYEDLLEQLIDEYGQSVKRLAYTYVKDWALAEDVTQEVFVKCFDHLHTFHGESTYKTWLYRITINHAKDMLKSKFFRQFDVIQRLKPQGGRTEQSAEARVVQDSEDEQLANEVLRLPRKYREIIILYYYEGLKMREIEAVTNLRMATVKTRLRRGKELLKQQLEGSE
ncbi:sigma-70 family RNA polymerase sigma factor [Pseudalkalibacillus caeni]|nr:sigma-70 family RNA polymerase sigma factor [Pseudalkalibacillus caeni]